MKKSDNLICGSGVGRRDFVKMAAGGAMAAALPVGAVAQGIEKGVDWWDAHPGKGGPGKPAAIDCHAHWSTRG